MLIYNLKNNKHMKTNNLEKFQLRGAIKEIMRNCNLRTISIANFEKWAKNNVADFCLLKM